MKDTRLVEMRVFKAVADNGGFTSAAHLLGVGQPFVSDPLIDPGAWRRFPRAAL